MQDLFGSVRRSLVFRPSIGGDDGGTTTGRLAEKIGSCIRKSRVGLGSFLPKLSCPPLPQPDPLASPQIRWRKGELIGCGAFGHVYMGMNLDSGELLAVKQVLIGTNNASKERAQAHIRELEEEVKLLKNLSHPNIVRYLGTAREEDTLNILMEFVPGGSISSLLGKFGSFPEAVIKMYTKQLLVGLDYLHRNGIIHRDIKGANILVDNKGCIKLADFGASKQVAKLATMTAAKSMKGTPFWMAPEVILQTGHSFSADIWSVGCTVIEMATGKPPWSQQFQEVAALFHIGTTKSHPPIPEHLSSEAKDFLLKCLQKEPSLRPTSSELLQHPFVTGEIEDTHGYRGTNANEAQDSKLYPRNCSTPTLTNVGREMDLVDDISSVSPKGLFKVRSIWAASCSDDDMCQLDDKDNVLDVGSTCKFDITHEHRKEEARTMNRSFRGVESISEKAPDDFTFPHGPFCDDDDDEVTETKIRAFLQEKALDLTKLQTPLYEFYNTLNASSSGVVGDALKENVINNPKLPPRSKSPSSKRMSGLLQSKSNHTNISPVDTSRRMSSYGGLGDHHILKEIPSPNLNELGGLLPDSQNKISPSFSEIKKKWKEELDQELERNRELMRQAGVSGRVSSPNQRGSKRECLRIPSPSR